MNRAVFLDRDGILNDVVMRNGIVSSPWSLEELRIVEEAKVLVRDLKRQGFLVFVVTNQPDVARGNLSEEDLFLINERVKRVFEVDGIECSLSADNEDPRRKPNPGMIRELCDQHGIAPGGSYFVGDGWKDMDAGRAAGVTTILLARPYNSAAATYADHTCHSYEEIVDMCRFPSGEAEDDV